VSHGLSAIRHVARKGGYSGTRWPTACRASPLLDPEPSRPPQNPQNPGVPRTPSLEPLTVGLVTLVIQGKCHSLSRLRAT
jgi:hypothetical protein